MLLVDLAALLALAVAVIAWWRRGAEGLQHLLIPAAVVGLLAAVAGVLDDRWQLAPVAVVSLLLLMGGLLRRRKAVAPGAAWVSGSLLGLAFLFGAFLVYLFPANDLPAPSGAQAVGVRDFMLVDDARKGVLAARADEPRKLLVRVWYPAGSVTGLAPRPYFTDAEARTTAEGIGSLVGAPFFFTYVKHVGTNSYVDAPLGAPADGSRLPVIIYSHGYTSFASQNTVLMEELASHGYIVYSVQHTYDASPTLFTDGTVAAMDPALVEMMQAQFTGNADDGFVAAFTAGEVGESYELYLENQRGLLEAGNRIATVSTHIWLDDRIFVHNALQAGAVPAQVAEIVAAGDLSRTGQMGMSFGGSTSGGFCMVDARCAAGINLDGGDYHLRSWLKNVPVPFLMLYSDFNRMYELLGGNPDGIARGFNDFTYERPEVVGLRDDVVRVSVKDVAHLGVSDFNLFMRNPLRALLFGPIDGGRIVQIQNDFVRGFFDTHLLGRDVGFPDAQLATHAEDVLEDSVADVREWWLDANPEDETVRVRFETSLGDVDVALYPNRAPLSVANFLAYVDADHYANASLYRSLQPTGTYGYGVIQGGILQTTMAGDGAAYRSPERPLPPIAHETTEQTGIPNERGTLAYARLAPGSAGSEFFFNITDNPVLDTGAEVPGRDGMGYATFGRVLRGMRVLEQIQALPTDGTTGMERLQGQILREPVAIQRVVRLD